MRLPSRPGRGGKSLLSTKKLSPAQKALLQNNGISVVDYNAISIHFTDVAIPPGFDFLVFTSQNGVKAFLKHSKGNRQPPSYEGKSCFCVGEKTKALLEKHGLQVVKMSYNAHELGHEILAQHAGASFLWVCGNRRREELPGLLLGHGVHLKELVAYETRLHQKTPVGTFDAILFFSPSGVQGFFENNALGEAVAYCIGPTTAAAVKKHTHRFKIAEKPTTDRVVRLAMADLVPAATPENKPSKEN